MSACGPFELPDPSRAIWAQRQKLSDNLDRIKEADEILKEVMGGPKDFPRQQWTQFVSLILEFQPDLIIELGRGWGNSTCAFSLAAEWLQDVNCKILSLCLSDAWQTKTYPRLLESFSRHDIFRRVEAMIADIRTFDFTKHLAGRRRVFVFWDVHGWDVAEAILTNLLSRLKDVAHLVVIHDMADASHMAPDCLVGDEAAWLALGSAMPKFRFGSMCSQYEEGILLEDFATRNQINLRSAESSYFVNLTPAQVQILTSLFGPTYFSQYGFWYFFSAYRPQAQLQFRVSRLLDGLEAADTGASQPEPVSSKSGPKTLRARLRAFVKPMERR